MKRRVVALLLAAVMTLSLAACGGGKDKAEGGSEEQYVNTYRVPTFDILLLD